MALHPRAARPASRPTRIRATRVRAGRRPPLPNDAGGERRSDTADRALPRLHDATPITTWHLAALLSGGGSTPTPNTPQAWANTVDRCQSAALATRLHT